MNSNNATKLLFGLLIVGTIVITPLPYYQPTVYCKFGANCPEPGWHVGKSIGQYVLAFTQNSATHSQQQTLTIPHISPISQMEAQNGSNSADVQLSTPTTNETISTPVTISGTISKTWTFEGVFRIEIQDASRNVITSSPVEATFPGETAITGSFTTSMAFVKTMPTGFIVIKNDNPSGLPENDKSFELPITFR